MSAPVLTEFLASLIAESLRGGKQGDAEGRGALDTAGGPGKLSSPLPAQAERIAEKLVAEALKSGLPLTNNWVGKSLLKGGNTAELVAQLTLHAPFAFKLDHQVKKLGEEGLTMRKIKGDMALPARFRDAWPVIYAVCHETPPYAYLMEFFPPEEGWKSLEDLLYPGDGPYPTQTMAIRWMNEALDILFTGYEASVDPRRKPSLKVDYYGRILERLMQTAKSDSRFASACLTVNGERLRPWESYLKKSKRTSIFWKK
jgi:hypothetical protein